MTGTEVSKIFSQRLSLLIEDDRKNGKGIREIANEIGISTGALSKYQNDAAAPDINALFKISEYFDVSADYLLGKIEPKKPENIDAQCRTGLPEEALNILTSFEGTKKSVLTLLLLNTNFPEFIDLLNVYVIGVKASDVVSEMNEDLSSLLGSVKKDENFKPNKEQIEALRAATIFSSRLSKAVKNGDKDGSAFFDDLVINLIRDTISGIAREEKQKLKATEGAINGQHTEN